MRAEAEELLRILELDDVRDELATSLPYGKQRRLEIARALATKLYDRASHGFGYGNF